MKNTKKFILKRQQAILKYLEENDYAKTEDLAKLLSTSNITIRRDFQTLEKQGFINRNYGGAKIIKKVHKENTPYDNLNEFNDKNEQVKSLIAKKAAEFIEDNDSIFINSSSTAIKMLEYIKDKRIVVITNNGKVLNMNLSPKIEVILTGGEVYGRKQAMVGDIATQIISKITAAKCFIGVSGIASHCGISTSVFQETAINMKMLKNCSGPTFVLTDSSKIGIHHNFSSGSIDDINYVITDKNADKEEVEKLIARGVKVIFSDDL